MRNNFHVSRLSSTSTSILLQDSTTQTQKSLSSFILTGSHKLQNNHLVFLCYIKNLSLNQLGHTSYFLKRQFMANANKLGHTS